jgi:hypothetical protein
LEKPNRQFVLNSVKAILRKTIKLTKTLFEGLLFNDCLNRIHEKSNLLLLIKLENGNVIGGFSEQPLSQTKFNTGKGFMMSVTNMVKFDILKQKEGRVIPFNNNKFAMGNEELIIYFHNMTYSVIFNTVSCFFETRNKDIVTFLGTEEEKGKFTSVEFHQMLLL